MSFKVGDKVKLRTDVLRRHARSVPAHLGYTTEQFAWRNRLRTLLEKTGTVSRLFDGSKHVNVDFADGTIGINHTELELLESADKASEEAAYSQDR